MQKCVHSVVSKHNFQSLAS